MGTEDYILEAHVWQAIGAACNTSGNTIPSVFGCRIPDLSRDCYQTSAESTLLFTTLVAPALLCQQFKHPKYYHHFIKLVQLINLCLDFEIACEHIQNICQGFAHWVTEYEQ